MDRMVGRFARDTSRDVEQLQMDLLRQAGGARRFELMCSLTETVIQLSFLGLRERHPDATEDELKVRFVALNHGDGLARGVAKCLGVTWAG